MQVACTGEVKKMMHDATAERFIKKLHQARELIENRLPVLAIKENECRRPIISSTESASSRILAESSKKGTKQNAKAKVRS